MKLTQDERYMKAAIRQAKCAAKQDEVPVGCVIVMDGEIIARAYNLREKKQSAIAHAEILCIERACKKVGLWRLCGATMYVTLEPCPMCAGAIINSRLDRVVFGAFDQKAGCCGSLYNLPEDARFNHRPEVTGGVLKEECAALLSDFFRAKR